MEGGPDTNSNSALEGGPDTNSSGMEDGPDTNSNRALVVWKTVLILTLTEP